MLAMSTYFSLLADVTFEDFTAPIRHSTGSWRDYYILFGAVALLTVVLLTWATYYAKRRKRRHRHHHHHHQSSPEAVAAAGMSSEPDSSRSHRRRRRRRPHRPRNPTLAETGGLPPLRADNQTEPLP